MDELKGFDGLDEDQKVKEVYSLYGLALYFAQVLEQQAITMIFIRKVVEKKFKSKEEVLQLWDRSDRSKRTLGTLINELNQLFAFSNELKDELEKFKNNRNYLAHDYHRLNIQLFYTDNGKKRMISDFVIFRTKAQKIDLALTEHLDEYSKKIGLTDEKVKDMMREMEVEANELVIDENFNTITL